MLTHYTDKEASPALVEHTIGRGSVLVLTTALELGPAEWFKLTEAKLNTLRGEGVPDAVLAKLATLKNKEFETRDDFAKALAGILDKAEREQHQNAIAGRASRGPWFQLTDGTLTALRAAGISDAALAKLGTLKGRTFDSRRDFLTEVARVLGPDDAERSQAVVASRAEVAPWNNYFGAQLLRLRAEPPPAQLPRRGHERADLQLTSPGRLVPVSCPPGRSCRPTRWPGPASRRRTRRLRGSRSSTSCASPRRRRRATSWCLPCLTTSVGPSASPPSA